MNTPNVNLFQLTQKFGTDEKCRKALEQLRWPDRPKCPRCKSDATPIANRFQYDCDSCHYQFSVTAGTIFHDSHLSIWKWFITTALLCEAKKGISACQIQRTVGMTYKTAWYLCHRIRAAMTEVNRPKLTGIVEMDETYVGGRAHRKRGRGAANKEVVIGIRQRQGELRFFHAEDVRSGTLEKYIRENISDDVDILMTDDLHLYKGAARHLRKQSKHKTIRHSYGINVQGHVHTNTVESAFSLLKRGVLGTWHRISAKHLQAYCNEVCFRFNNRKNPYLLRDTMQKLIGSPSLEYRDLTSNARDAA